MTITPVQIVAGQYLTNATATYYTSTGIKTRIDKATATNSDSVAHVITVYLVPSGGAPTASNIVIPGRSVPATTTYHCPELIGHILNAGDTFQAKADANSVVSIAAAGVTISP